MDNNEVVHNYSECFFGYKLDIGKDELDLKENKELWPRIYLERKDSKLSIFFTFPEWFEPVLGLEKNEAELVYNEAEVIFDSNGTSIENILKRAKSDELIIDEVIKFPSDSFKTDYRYTIPMEKVNSFSGVGAIVLRRGRSEAVFYYAINYVPKKRIYYEIDANKIIFKTKANIDKIKVKILKNSERMLCLNEGINEEGVTLELKGGSATVKTQCKNQHVFVDFYGDRDELSYYNRNYLLVCVNDKTRVKEKKNKRLARPEILCPYCNKPMNMDKSYSGICSCNGERLDSFEFLNSKGKRVKNVIICQANARAGGSRVNRMLPNDIMKRRNYRIAILGKSRSGKTTYISRLLNITGSNNNLLVKPEESAFSHKYNIKYWASNLISEDLDKKNSKMETYNIRNLKCYQDPTDGKEYYDFISNYSISVREKKFMEATNIDEFKTLQNPFILSVGNNAYVNIYDIAGENVTKDKVGKLNIVTAGEDKGLFIILDMHKGKEYNEKVLDNARSAYYDNMDNVPVAVIISKFDTIENEFSPNCACLRGDYSSLFTKYLTDSSLMNHIDAASDEIESYLIKNNYDIRRNQLEGFNVKFFGVSAITYTDAMYHKENVTTGDDTHGEENGLNFMCASKRVELPLIWVLHELGEI